MSQLHLDSLSPPVSLTERQELALRLIRERGPLRHDELGAALCEARGYHRSDSRCQFDGHTGKELGRALAVKGLVRFLRGRGWVAAEWQEPVEGYDPRTAEIPY